MNILFSSDARRILAAGVVLSLLSTQAFYAQNKSASKDTPTVALPGAPATPAIDPKKYIIGAEDVLSIKVWREAELSGPAVVRPDGKISMPLVGEIQAAGITPESLSATIAEGLSKYMTRPEVSVSVTVVNSKRYFISGEVNRPGAYPLLIPTTILEALVNAGGFRDFADTKKIVVLRGAARRSFNYKEVIKGKKTEQNVLLEPGDHIIVP
jgi:polysaccharide biosynthesis/export protein